MKQASAIVTNQGGRTCHAAIIAREMGIPAIVGCGDATNNIKTGREVTVSCADGEQGKVYASLIPFTVESIELDNLPETKTQILMNVGDPESAFGLSALPCDGVGLARLEFIIANHIKVHPLALLKFDELKDSQEKIAIARQTLHYSYKPDFFVDKLSRGIATIADDMGLTNLIPMIPFCRTPDEGRKVLAEMAKHGLVKGENGLQVYVMCELPSNVMLAAEFSEVFDGFSIGSNDLTQLTLGLDRDSSLVAHLFDERNPAVEAMLTMAIAVAQLKHRKIGICGQAPSDYPEFAEFLVKEGIDSISLNPDSVFKTRLKIAEVEAKIDHK